MVKGISAGKEKASISCVLDLQDWEEQIELDYDRIGRPYNFLETYRPSGWSLGEEPAGHTDTLQITMRAPTPLDVALKLQEDTGCAIAWDTVNKNVKIIWPEDMPISNAYVMDGVNLTQAPEYKGDTRNYYTRIYPFGADDPETGSQITIEGITGTLYIDNTPPGGRVISRYWEDVTIEDAEALFDAAQKRLLEDSQPRRSWNLKIIDLYRSDPKRWPGMSVAQYTKLKLIDQYKGITAVVQVSEDKVYPYYPGKNEITVSTVAGSIQRSLARLLDSINNPNSDFNRRLRVIGGRK